VRYFSVIPATMRLRRVETTAKRQSHLDWPTIQAWQVNDDRLRCRGTSKAKKSRKLAHFAGKRCMLTVNDRADGRTS
jgi:hypothetical protein